MPLPVGVETVTVSSGVPLTGFGGALAKGRLLFTGPDLVTISEDDVVLGGTAEVVLEDGAFSISLVATDATGMSPSGWTYRVEAALTNGPGWVRYMTLPKASPAVKLADVLVPDPVAGEFTVLIDGSTRLAKAANLADLADVATARTSLGLGAAATRDVGTTAGTVAAGNDLRMGDARTPTGQASGDLSGTYPNPAVAAVNGVEVTGVAASGKVLTATSPAAATWQTPSGGGGGGSTVAYSDGISVTDDPSLAILPTAASWTVVQSAPGTKLQDSFEAQAGDWFEPLANALLGGTGGQWLDWALLDADGDIDTYAGTMTGTPLPQGNPVIYPSTSFNTISSPPVFKIEARHIDGDGKATIALVHQGSGDRKVYTHPELPFHLRTRRTRPA